MINELLTTLMEDSMFVDIMTIDILEEGLFDKKGYYTSEEKYKNTISSRSYVHDSPIKALRSEIGIRCKGKLKEWKQYQTNFNEYNTKIIINKKYENILDDTTLYLYTIKMNDKFFTKNDKKYGMQISKNSEIINTEKATLREFAKKYHVPIEIVGDKDVNVDTESRAKLITTITKIFKEELKILKSKYPIKNSIYMETDDDKDDFINGVYDQLTIASYDLWKFDDNARDDEVSEKFWKYADEMTNNVNKEISKYGAKVVADGDWDTGSFYLEIK